MEGDENLDRVLWEIRGRAACQIEEGWYEVMARCGRPRAVLDGLWTWWRFVYLLEELLFLLD